MSIDGDIKLAQLELQKQLDTAKAQAAVRERVRQDHAQLDAQVTALKDAVAAHEEAAVALQQMALTQQSALQQRLENIVSYALTTIFARPYLFKVLFEQRGQQAEVSFMIQDELGTLQDIKEAHGGGLLVVTAFLLRVIVTLSAHPPMRRILLLDEPFIQVSEEYRENLATFLRDFAEKADVQLILVTHEPTLAQIGDKRYRFSLERGVTKVEEL